MPAAEVLLVATSQHLLAVRGDDVRIVHHGAGLYFGIAELGGRRYVACHHQVIRDPTVEELEAQRGSLLVLDDELRAVGSAQPPDFVLRQPHGIGVVDGRLWVTCSYDDLVVVHDPVAGTWERWHPGRGMGPPKPTHHDPDHYNAIAADGPDRFRLLAHDYGASQVLTFDTATRDLLAVADVGAGAHDLVEREGRLVVSSSLEGALASPDGWVRRVGAMPRGLAHHDGHTVVGLSEVAERRSRHATTGRLAWYDASWRCRRLLELPEVGQVLEAVVATVPAGCVDELAALPGAHPVDPATDEARRALGVAVPRSVPAVPWGDWHDGEPDQQWSAARRARLPLVVESTDRELVVELVSYRPEALEVRVALDGHDLGPVGFAEPGHQVAALALPGAVAGRTGVDGGGRRAELTVEVPSLWQPPGDARRIGVGLVALWFR